MRPGTCGSAPAPGLRGSLLTSGIDARSQARCAGRTSQRQRATSPERSRGWPPWTRSENRSPTPMRTNAARGPGPLADDRTRPIDPARAEPTEMSQLRHDDLTARLLACAEVLPSLHRQEEHRDRAAPRTTSPPLTALNYRRRPSRPASGANSNTGVATRTVSAILGRRTPRRPPSARSRPPARTGRSFVPALPLRPR